MSEIDKKLKQIEEQREEIRDIERFLFVLDTCKRMNTRKSNISAIIKTKTTKEFSIFSSRWFGWGTHKEEIEVPESIFDDLEMVLYEKLKAMKEYFEGIKISHE